MDDSAWGRGDCSYNHVGCYRDYDWLLVVSPSALKCFWLLVSPYPDARFRQRHTIDFSFYAFTTRVILSFSCIRAFVLSILRPPTKDFFILQRTAAQRSFLLRHFGFVILHSLLFGIIRSMIVYSLRFFEHHWTRLHETICTHIHNIPFSTSVNPFYFLSIFVFSATADVASFFSWHIELCNGISSLDSVYLFDTLELGSLFSTVRRPCYY